MTYSKTTFEYLKYVKIHGSMGWDTADYIDYLVTIRDRLPRNASEYALAKWRYDYQDPRCLHDSWLECLSLQEYSAGKRRQTRYLEVFARLLGSYHNGYTEFLYSGVSSYRLSYDEKTGSNRGHGDWVIDEVRLSPSGLVTHEILFSHAALVINCEDIRHRWIGVGAGGASGKEVSEVEDGTLGNAR